MADVVTLPLILDAIIILLLIVLVVLVYRRLVSQSHATPQPGPYASSPSLTQLSFEEHILRLLEERHALKSEELAVRRKQAVGIFSGHEANAAIKPIHARLKAIDSELTRAGVL